MSDSLLLCVNLADHLIHKDHPLSPILVAIPRQPITIAETIRNILRRNPILLQHICHKFFNSKSSKSFRINYGSSLTSIINQGENVNAETTYSDIFLSLRLKQSGDTLCSDDALEFHVASSSVKVNNGARLYVTLDASDKHQLFGNGFSIVWCAESGDCQTETIFCQGKRKAGNEAYDGDVSMKAIKKARLNEDEAVMSKITLKEGETGNDSLIPNENETIKNTGKYMEFTHNASTGDKSVNSECENPGIIDSNSKSASTSSSNNGSSAGGSSTSGSSTSGTSSSGTSSSGTSSSGTSSSTSSSESEMSDKSDNDDEVKEVKGDILVEHTSQDKSKENASKLDEEVESNHSSSGSSSSSGSNSSDTSSDSSSDEESSEDEHLAIPADEKQTSPNETIKDDEITKNEVINENKNDNAELESNHSSSGSNSSDTSSGSSSDEESSGDDHLAISADEKQTNPNEIIKDDEMTKNEVFNEEKYDNAEIESSHSSSGSSSSSSDASSTNKEKQDQHDNEVGKCNENKGHDGSFESTKDGIKNEGMKEDDDEKTKLKSNSGSVKIKSSTDSNSEIEQPVGTIINNSNEKVDNIIEQKDSIAMHNENNANECFVSSSSSFGADKPYSVNAKDATNAQELGERTETILKKVKEKSKHVDSFGFPLSAPGRAMRTYNEKLPSDASSHASSSSLNSRQMSETEKASDSASDSSSSSDSSSDSTSSSDDSSDSSDNSDEEEEAVSLKEMFTTKVNKSKETPPLSQASLESMSNYNGNTDKRRHPPLAPVDLSKRLKDIMMSPQRRVLSQTRSSLQSTPNRVDNQSNKSLLSDPVLMKSPLFRFTVKELKSMCQDKELPVTGTKAELVERIMRSEGKIAAV